MFALLAAVLALVGYILDGSKAHTSPWLSPGALTLACLALLALHLTTGNWPWRK
jgi:hypothetical protein